MAVPQMKTVSPARALLTRVWNSWATRSLAVGAAATVLDIALGTSLLTLGVHTRFSAMTGTALGAIFTFVANRYFAFRETTPSKTSLGQSAVRFFILTALSSLVHGQVVVWLRDSLGVPFVPAKVVADLAVFTFGQLILLRYVVFPQAKKAKAAVDKALPALDSDAPHPAAP